MVMQFREPLLNLNVPNGTFGSFAGNINVLPLPHLLCIPLPKLFPRLLCSLSFFPTYGEHIHKRL